MSKKRQTRLYPWEWTAIQHLCTPGNTPTTPPGHHLGSTLGCQPPEGYAMSFVALLGAWFSEISKREKNQVFPLSKTPGKKQASLVSTMTPPCVAVVSGGGIATNSAPAEPLPTAMFTQKKPLAAGWSISHTMAAFVVRIYV